MQVLLQQFEKRNMLLKYTVFANLYLPKSGFHFDGANE